MTPVVAVAERRPVMVPATDGGRGDPRGATRALPARWRAAEVERADPRVAPPLCRLPDRRPRGLGHDGARAGGLGAWLGRDGRIWPVRTGVTRGQAHGFAEPVPRAAHPSAASGSSPRPARIDRPRGQVPLAPGDRPRSIPRATPSIDARRAAPAAVPRTPRRSPASAPRRSTPRAARPAARRRPRPPGPGSARRPRRPSRRPRSPRSTSSWGSNAARCARPGRRRAR